MKEDTETSTFALLASDNAFDPVEDGVRQRVRRFIEAILEEELQAALGRGRYERSVEGSKGHRNGHRERQVIGTFGAEAVMVPRARLVDGDGRAMGSAITGAAPLPAAHGEGGGADRLGLLAGTDTRRVKRAFGLFEGAVSKDVVSRAWRKIRTDWEAWCARSLATEDIVRLILDGMVKARIDRKATAISVLAAIGVRRDGQKVLFGDQEHGRREQGGLASVPRRPRRPRPRDADVHHCRWRSGSRGGAGRAVAGCADPALHGP